MARGVRADKRRAATKRDRKSQAVDHNYVKAYLYRPRTHHPGSFPVIQALSSIQLRHC